MKVSQIGKEFIKKWEGYKEKAYFDIGGLGTIGYGHLISPPENLTVITQAQAEQLFEEDIEKVENALNKLIKIPISQSQFDSIASLTFNWGIDHIAKSKGLADINKGDFAQALVEFQGVDKVNGKIAQGLLNRRIAEANLFSGTII